MKDGKVEFNKWFSKADVHISHQSGWQEAQYKRQLEKAYKAGAKKQAELIKEAEYKCKDNGCKYHDLSCKKGCVLHAKGCDEYDEMKREVDNEGRGTK